MGLSDGIYQTSKEGALIGLRKGLFISSLRILFPIQPNGRVRLSPTPFVLGNVYLKET